MNDVLGFAGCAGGEMSGGGAGARPYPYLRTLRPLALGVRMRGEEEEDGEVVEGDVGRAEVDIDGAYVDGYGDGDAPRGVSGAPPVVPVGVDPPLLPPRACALCSRRRRRRRRRRCLCRRRCRRLRQRCGRPVRRRPHALRRHPPHTHHGRVRRRRVHAPPLLLLRAAQVRRLRLDARSRVHSRARGFHLVVVLFVHGGGANGGRTHRTDGERRGGGPRARAAARDRRARRAAAPTGRRDA